MDSKYRSYLAELIGTFAVVFIGAGTICAVKQLAELPGQLQPYYVSIALAEGFILAAALTATVPVSGGYLDPAITLTLWVFRRLEGSRVLWLIGGQLLGSVLAGLVVRLVFADDVLLPAQNGAPHLNLAAFAGAGRSLGMLCVLSGIGIELILTFLLTFAIFGTMIDPRAPRLGGLSVGLTLTALVLMGYPLTGASMNPARWFGPTLWELTTVGGEAFRQTTWFTGSAPFSGRWRPARLTNTC